MQTFLEMLVSLSAAGSAVVICMLILRMISPNLLPATWRYVIGKVAIAFYLIPVAFGIQCLSWLWTSHTNTSAMIANESAIVPQALPLPGFDPEPILPELSVSSHIVFPLIGIWGIGAIVFSVWQLYCYRTFSRHLHHHSRTDAPEQKEAVKQLALSKEALDIQTNVQLVYNSAVRSPLLIGLWKPTIYLPVKNTNVDLRMVIHHELIHLKRKDLWVKAMILAASALHWFNPLVHILRKEIHTWSELSCDEEVVKDMSHAERKRYGETILNVMIGSKGVPVRFCASLSGDGKQVKRRLQMMLNVKKLNTRMIVLATASLVAAGAVGTSAAVWASKHVPEVETASHNATQEGVGGSAANTHVSYIPYSVLSDYEKEVATKEIASYYVDATGRVIDHTDGELVSFDALSAEEQQRVRIEDGYFSDHLLTPQQVRQRMLEDQIITEEELERLNAAHTTIVYKDVGDSIVYNGVQYWKYSALTPDEQTFIIEEQLRGQLYALAGYEHPVPADELTPEEQRQVTIEEGFYSRGTIERIKEYRETFPRGETVTVTHEDDASVPPGMSVTIRDLTPEEIAEMEQRRAEHEKQ